MLNLLSSLLLPITYVVFVTCVNVDFVVADDVAAAAAASTTTTVINRNCPCLSDPALEESASEIAQDEEELSAIDDSLNITSYGIGCGPHDNTDDSCGDGSRQRDWCNAEFCWVDPNNCDLQHHASFKFVENPRYYSYAACGYVDTFSRDPERMEGKEIKIVKHENFRGYQGTICHNKEEIPFTSTDDCYGTTIDLLEYIIEESEYNFNLTFTTVPDWVTEKAEAFPLFIDNNENMKHGACVYAASLEVVDVCLGAFTKNIERTQVSSFIEMGVTSEYLIVTKTVEEPTTGQHIRDIFAPFSPALWGVTFGVLMILSLLFIAQETSLKEFKKSPVNAVTMALYQGSLSFFVGGPETVEGEKETWGGRFTLLAIAVVVLLEGASYTANLTNFLVQQGMPGGIESMEDTIQQTVPVCVLRNKIPILDNVYGKDKIKYAISPVDDLPGFLDREELFPAMENGTCVCAVASEEELTMLHAEGLHCEIDRIGDPVIELPWGVPVSEEFIKPLNTAIAKLMQNGQWRQITDKNKPASLCSGQEDDSDGLTPLTPHNLLGAYVLAGVLAGVGVLVNLIGLVNKKNKQQQQKSSSSETSRMTQEDSIVGSQQQNGYSLPHPLPSNSGDPMEYGGLISIEHFQSAMGSLLQEIVGLKMAVNAMKQKDE
mmetsp:Transcript_25086/g.26920  ORF Transcript_25086/g.26920 Transcript_25086/m.26920 type:complete len:659 (-) Transcript_25086:209-2185(-)